MDERQKLIKKLHDLNCSCKGKHAFYTHEFNMVDIGLIADFILQDRKRVVAPLLEPHTIHKGNELDTCIKAIKQTLTNAGVAQ